MEKKLIKVMGKELLLTEEEALKQFEKLIWKFVREIHGYDYEELYQVSAIGFIKAFRSYNGSVNFSTYLGTVIRNELYMYIRRNKRHQDLLSLDATFDDKESMTYGDFVADKTNYEDLVIEKFQNEELQQCISKLNEREKLLINQYMYKHMTQIDVAEKLNLSQSYVSRLQMNTISKLLKMMNEGKGNKMTGINTKITFEKIREQLKIGKNNTEIIKYLTDNFNLTEKTAQTYLYRVKKEFRSNSKANDVKEIIAKRVDITEKEVFQEVITETKTITNKATLEILEIHVKGSHNQYRITMDQISIINPSDILNHDVLEEYKEVMAFRERAINNIGA